MAAPIGPIGVEPLRAPQSPRSPSAPVAIRPHHNVAKHLANLGGRVFCIITGDKIVAGRKKRERRYMISTAAMLFLMAPNGAVKRAWAWPVISILVHRQQGHVSELLMREAGEKDVVLAPANAPENAPPGIDDALDVIARLGRPYRVNVLRDFQPAHGGDSLAEEAKRSPHSLKPNARHKIAELQPPQSPVSSPALSPSHWQHTAAAGPTDWERRALDMDADVGRGGFADSTPPRAPQRSAHPTPDELTPAPAAPPRAPTELAPGMRVLVDRSKPGTLERRFREEDLSSPFGTGGLVSERMAQHMVRAEFWWVLLDEVPPGLEGNDDERAVLRRGATLTPLGGGAARALAPGAPPASSEPWDGGWTGP
eukprot:TRINITY_DN9231_c0_g1_i1.p1 TRINITY_DN9231_c0_g1~~TRINITY_DN9231_c0_g1_i1.p1  ORF type:complete len:368 (+),score=90.16 TRINITY_DN9231_c0_g1_i1:78-1181(+)